MQTMKLTWKQISVWCGAGRLNGSKKQNLTLAARLCYIPKILLIV